MVHCTLYIYIYIVYKIINSCWLNYRFELHMLHGFKFWDHYGWYAWEDRRKKDIIKMNIKQTKFEDVNWIKLTENMVL
jgi:hypothetical protein